MNVENDVVINTVSALLLAIEPTPHYAAQVAACMIKGDISTLID